LNTQKYSPLTYRPPDDVIAYRSDGAVAVRQFVSAAQVLSQQLPRHQYVFNLLTDRYQYLLGFCAAVIAGQCTLLPPNRLAKTLEHLANDYPDSYVLGGPDSSDNKVFSIEGFGELTGLEGDVPSIPEDQLCAIAFTSGSTGQAKPNRKTWKTLRIGSENNVGFLLEDVTGQMNLLATVPPQHMWGFETSVILPLFANVAVSHLTPFFPQDIAEALDSLPEPRALISSPVHLKVLLTSGVQTPKIDRVYCATAPLNASLANELESRFSTKLVEIFGSSETGMFAYRHTATEDSWRVSELFAFDVRQDGVQIQAQHLPEPVYLQDIIEKTGERQFRLLGRDQDMVNIAGKRGLLTDLNRCLLAIPGVLDGVIFMPGSNTERLAALVVAPGLEPADILRELRLEIDAVFLPRPLCMVSSLPRQETGKLTNEDIMNLYRGMAQMENSSG